MPRNEPMADRAREKETYLELQEDDALSGEHLDSQVQKAQEQLVLLRRQQDQIEKQKRELEELSRRQELLQQGKGEMVEKLTRALVVVERETHEAQKRVEQLQAVNDSYIQHLSTLETINPKNWDNLDINKELNRSLSAVDDARAEYARSIPKIKQSEASAPETSTTAELYAAGFGQPPEKDFLYWLKSGFAFTLPLLTFGVVVAVVVFLRFSNI